MTAEPEELEELEKILSTMDIPVARVSPLRNVHWLLRNLGVRNSRHPQFARAFVILKKFARMS